MKKRYLFICLLIVLCAAVIFYFVVPVIAHLAIIGTARNYQPEASASFDEKYTLQTLKHEEETGTYASFAIGLTDTGERLYLCPDKYRTMDLKSISWEDGSYTVSVISGDVGAIYYCYMDDIWIKSSKKDIEWSVSKYSETASRFYEESPNGYKAAFYKKSEIDIVKIKDWLASCAPSEGYYSYIYSDPDSWDVFIYYSPENGELSGNGFKFSVADSIVIVYVSSDGSARDAEADYFLIRVQAPLRGAWPNSAELYLDGVKIERITGQESY